jgi:signal transduction histidine kinase
MGSGRRRWSLRARLTAAGTLAVAVLLAGAGAVLVWRLHMGMLADLDTAAVRSALAVEAAAHGPAGPTVPPSPGQSLVTQVVDAAGRVVASSDDVQGEQPIFRSAAPAPGSAPVVWTDHAGPLGGSAYRVAALTTTAQPHYRVYVGLPLGPVTSSTAQLVAALAVTLPLLVGALAAITWLLTGRALHPVETLRRQAADVTATDLHRRVDVPPAADELSRLAETLNDLLARLDSGQRLQRQFIADAAHELRSPVAAIRLQLETADIEGSTRTAVIQQSIRLARLVDDLMSLARLDARPELRQEEVDLDDVVRSEVELLRPVTAVEIDTRQLRTVRVLGDEALLGRMVRNLLDNAARYAATRITVASSPAEGDALLVVADDGPGIAAVDRQRVFDRFTRLDGARSRDEGGVGLGLAIVSDIITAHGGTVQAHDNEPGTRVEVRLPAVADQIDPLSADAW